MPDFGEPTWGFRSACALSLRIVVGFETRPVLASAIEASERTGEALFGQGGDFVVACPVQKFLHLLLANGELAESKFDPFHGQRKQHQQHWEEDHGETLHTGK